MWEGGGVMLKLSWGENGPSLELPCMRIVSKSSEYNIWYYSDYYHKCSNKDRLPDTKYGQNVRCNRYIIKLQEVHNIVKYSTNSVYWFVWIHSNKLQSLL